ncbi:MAG: iron chelate uptake ABC transporter family permease subunit, partial [Agromyces sp.]
MTDTRASATAAADAVLPSLARDPARGLAPRTRSLLLFGGLGVALVVGVVFSAGAGQLPVPPHEVWNSLLRGLGLSDAPEALPNTDSALWNIRFPRIAMALLIGAALAMAGTVMQAIFANPLAEPGVVGVSSGAALGAAAAIVLGWTAFGDWVTA